MSLYKHTFTGDKLYWRATSSGLVPFLAIALLHIEYQTFVLISALVSAPAVGIGPSRFQLPSRLV